MFFDLQESNKVAIELWGTLFKFNIIDRDGMLDIIEDITLLTGRMHRPPSWTQHGAVVGLEGGTANVSRIVKSLQDAGVPLAGIWLQDWVYE